MPLGVSRINNNISRRVPLAITNAGGATLSSTQAKFGPTSLAVSISAGTSTHYVTLPNTATELNFAISAQFTYECWVYPVAITGTASNAHYFIDFRSSASDPNGLGINISTSGSGGRFLVTGLGSNPVITGTTNTYTANTWYHVAVTRNASNTVTLWVNGTNQGTAVISNSLSVSGKTVAIGRGATTTAQTFRGYIDEVRISNIARYTAAFTPSTTRFQNDGNTVFLSHFDGVNAAITFVEDNGAG